VIITNTQNVHDSNATANVGRHTTIDENLTGCESALGLSHGFCNTNDVT
jgi:hypothetical protein